MIQICVRMCRTYQTLATLLVTATAAAKGLAAEKQTGCAAAAKLPALGTAAPSQEQPAETLIVLTRQLQSCFR